MKILIGSCDNRKEKKKKKKTLQEGYLSKSQIFLSVNFIINITKKFLENKVEILVICKLIKLIYNDRYFKKWDYLK